MSTLTVFENETFGSVRTLDEDGRVLFCGNDVAKALGYKRPADATLSRKMNGESDFTRSEIQLFRSELGLSAKEIDYIFFC